MLTPQEQAQGRKTPNAKQQISSGIPENLKIKPTRLPGAEQHEHVRGIPAKAGSAANECLP